MNRPPVLNLLLSCVHLVLHYFVFADYRGYLQGGVLVRRFVSVIMCRVLVRSVDRLNKLSVSTFRIDVTHGGLKAPRFPYVFQ